MKTQPTLFDISKCKSEPWPIPSNLKRISMLDWLKENAEPLALKFCEERPRFSFLDNDLIHDFRHGKFSAPFIKQWVEQKYHEAMQHV